MCKYKGVAMVFRYNSIFGDYVCDMRLAIVGVRKNRSIPAHIKLLAYVLLSRSRSSISISCCDGICMLAVLSMLGNNGKTVSIAKPLSSAASPASAEMQQTGPVRTYVLHAPGAKMTVVSTNSFKRHSIRQ